MRVLRWYWIQLLVLAAIAAAVPFAQGQQEPCSITVSDVTALYNELGSPSTSTVVCIMPGTYAFPNQRTINRSVSFRGLGTRPEDVVISNQYGSQIVFYVTNGAGLSVNFENLKVTQGSGAIYLNTGVSSVLKNVILDGCTSTTQSQAAGLHLFGSNNVVMTDSVISNNQVWDYGAGMRIGSFSNVQLQNVAFSNNAGAMYGSTNYGGAIAIDTVTTVTVTSCTFTNNRAYSGGAIGVKAGVSNSLSISKSTFTGNTCAGSGWGHALSLGTTSNSRTAIYKSTFNGNYVAGTAASSSIYTASGATTTLLIYNMITASQVSSNGFANSDVGFGGSATVIATNAD
ncbi:hypothetical protein CAOG_08669, partial [Capsaspora owczarzaki ATCC 30864]